MSASTGKSQLIPQIYTADRRDNGVAALRRACDAGLMRRTSSKMLVRQLVRENILGLMTGGRYIPQWLRSTLR